MPKVWRSGERFGLRILVGLAVFPFVVALPTACRNDAGGSGRTAGSEWEGKKLGELEARRAEIQRALEGLPRFSMRSGSGSVGFRTKGYPDQGKRQWIEIRLDREAVIDRIVMVPTIWRSMGEGFRADGFPEEFRILAGAGSDRKGEVVASFDRDDGLLPRVAPVVIDSGGDHGFVG